MGELQTQVWVSMAFFAFVTSITPGPNNLMLLASGVNFGARASVPHMLGISCGFFGMLVAVGLGMGELFVQVPSLYPLMKALGMVYMLYLAWGIARSAPPQAHQEGAHAARPLGFWGAAAFQWVNPKAWVMALGFFSNYLPQHAGAALIAAASLLFSLINLPCVGVWALLGMHLRQTLQVGMYRRLFNGTMALLLVLSMAVGLFMQ